MRTREEVLRAAKAAESFISELVGVHIIIPDTELAEEAHEVLAQLRAATGE